MVTALVSRQFAEQFGDEIGKIAKEAGKAVELMTLPEPAGTRLSQADCDRIDCTFLDTGIRADGKLHAAYTDALVASKSCKWIQVPSSGVNPTKYISALSERGATITSSTGANREPVAQTGFTGLLMLARGFPGWIQAQRRHEWKPQGDDALPDDLRGQTMLQIGVGAVGKVFAGYAKAFGLHVIGVRRSPREPGDVVDELHPPSKLNELLPRADWIVITCPLTKETRNLLDAAAFGRMRKGVRLVNIARGEIVDEKALLEALRSGHVGGAFLDAHVTEPLPADSPFWDLPNVIVTPHNAAASTGNEKRRAEIFIANFGHWLRGEKMLNIQDVS